MNGVQQKSKTEQIVLSAYHPETNGLLERFNQTLQNMLAKVCPDGNDWDLYLDKITFSYRSINQKSTKTSPFQVMFGRNCFQNEEESQMEKPVPDDVDMEDWLKKMIDIREQINVQVKENVKKTQEAQVRSHKIKKMSHKMEKKIYEGDMVLGFNAKRFTRKGSKSEKNWQGPFIERSLYPKGIVELQNEKNMCCNEKEIQYKIIKETYRTGGENRWKF